jgi:3-hydroxyisobutyrate dehydrogenase
MRVAVLGTGIITLELGDTIGTASRMKLVLNSWVLAIGEGVAESILLAERLGLDPRMFLDFVDDGPLSVPYASSGAR